MHGAHVQGRGQNPLIFNHSCHLSKFLINIFAPEHKVTWLTCTSTSLTTSIKTLSISCQSFPARWLDQHCNHVKLIENGKNFLRRQLNNYSPTINQKAGQMKFRKWWWRLKIHQAFICWQLVNFLHQFISRMEIFILMVKLSWLKTLPKGA